MTILYNGGRTAVKAFFCSYILKGGKYMKFNRLNGVSSPLLTIKPETVLRPRLGVQSIKDHC